MAKYEAIDLTLSDADFIQAKKAIYPFLYQASVTSSFYYNGNYFTGSVHIRSNYCSLAKSARLIILHCQKLEVSLRDDNVNLREDSLSEGKTITGSSGKTSLDLSKCFSRIGCWAYRGWLCCYTI